MKHITLFFFTLLSISTIYFTPIFAQSLCDKREQQKHVEMIKKYDKACIKTCEPTPDPITCRKACAYMTAETLKELKQEIKDSECLY